MIETSQRSRITAAIAVLLPLALLATVVVLFYGLRSAGTGPAGGGSAEVAALSQSIPLNAAAAARGNVKAFDSVGTGLARLEQLSAAGLPGSAALWESLQRDGAAVMAARDDFTSVQTAARSVNELVPGFSTGISELLVATQTPILTQRFDAATGAMVTSLTTLADGAGDIDRDTVAVTSAVDFVGRMLAALGGTADTEIEVAVLTDEAQLAQLESADLVFQQIAQGANAAVAGAPALRDVQESARALTRTAKTLFTQTTAADSAAGAAASNLSWLPLLLIAAAAVGSIILVRDYFSASKLANSAGHQANQNDRNQQAILRLLDELGSLADGDLTVQATVTEDITGAIADSINYAIEALRDLVATINDTAIMVDSAAKQTEAAGQNMSASSRQQAHEVAATADALGAIVAAIEEVSGNAERSSDVARHSVDVAHKGGEAVRRTIEGMNTIRETIQETSKRIKRLGESSQEIGDIVELINDIAEQTNILALNASIQASMAGEAGRGFAVVADEVQRLAERSTNATKQIEVLVRTIQSDTNEAVVSMERSTTDVVGGALLAENAGAALDEIEQVSNQIASLVQNISSSTREQSSVANDIDKRTANLKEISDKTERETATTAQAIRKLSELASQLRKTVAGFQLPDFGVSSHILAGDDEGEDGGDVVSEPPSRAGRQA